MTDAAKELLTLAKSGLAIDTMTSVTPYFSDSPHKKSAYLHETFGDYLG